MAGRPRRRAARQNPSKGGWRQEGKRYVADSGWAVTTASSIKGLYAAVSPEGTRTRFKTLREALRYAVKADRHECSDDCEPCRRGTRGCDGRCCGSEWMDCPYAKEKWGEEDSSKRRNPDTIQVVPAYGRDHKSAAEVQKAWAEGKDFRINEPGHRYHGSYINKEDADNGQVTVVVKYRAGQQNLVIAPSRSNPHAWPQGWRPHNTGGGLMRLLYRNGDFELLAGPVSALKSGGGGLPVRGQRVAIWLMSREHGDTLAEKLVSWDDFMAWPASAYFESLRREQRPNPSKSKRVSPAVTYATAIAQLKRDWPSMDAVRWDDATVLVYSDSSNLKHVASIYKTGRSWQDVQVKEFKVPPHRGNPGRSTKYRVTYRSRR